MLNDGTPVSLGIADVTAAEGGTFTFTVTADRAPTSRVTFKYTVTAQSGDTATAGADFTAVTTPAEVTIAANARSATFPVAVIDDVLDEDDETFTVTLSAPSSNATIGDGVAKGKIQDNDAMPTVRIVGTSTESDTVVDEGDAGDTTPMPFKVIPESATSGRQVSAPYVVTDGSATAGEDYRMAAGRVVFPAGARGSALTQTITGYALGDDRYEGGASAEPEAFTVELQKPVNAERYRGGGDSKPPVSPLPSDLLGGFSGQQGSNINNRVNPGIVPVIPDVGNPGIQLPPVNQKAFGRIRDDDQRPVPAKPTGLTATAGDRRATLAWTELGDASVTKWQYQQKVDSNDYGRWMDIADSSASTTRHGVENLTNGSIYSFRIRAVNTSGDGVQSAEVTVTPLALPAAPTGFTATAGDGQVTLAWEAPQDASITRWEFRQKKVLGTYGSWTPIAGAPITSHIVENLVNGDSYVFQLRAVNRIGDGDASVEATARPISATPRKPTGLTAVGGHLRVTLSWNNPGNPAITGLAGAGQGRRWRLRELDRYPEFRGYDHRLCGDGSQKWCEVHVQGARVGRW